MDIFRQWYILPPFIPSGGKQDQGEYFRMTTMRALATIGLLVTILALQSCRKENPDQTPGSQPANKQRGNLQVLAEGLTGQHAIRSGQQAQEQIKEIATQHQEKRNEITGE
jgi:hypothetical protein